MVTISPQSISFLSSISFKAGSKDVALHELVEIILWRLISSFSSFAPKIRFIWAFLFGWVKKMALTGSCFKRFISSCLKAKVFIWNWKVN